jgi:hypothetical protein
LALLELHGQALLRFTLVLQQVARQKIK